MPRPLQNSQWDQPSRHPYRLRRRAEERVEVLGGRIDLVKSAEVFHFVGKKLEAGERAIVANHNLHSLYLVKKSSDMRRFYEAADITEVDSAPLIFWARLVGRPSRRFHRCTYLDWREEFWSLADSRRWRVFFVGGEVGVGEAAREKILSRWPGVDLRCHHGYFAVGGGSPENAEVIRQINAFEPDVLLVGMGMPRQESWVLNNVDAIKPCAVFTLGGAFDYEAGVQATPPRWLGRLGVEWAFRLACNPRRMFRRYCVEPWSLVSFALQDVARMFAAARTASHGMRRAAGVIRWTPSVKDR